MTEDQFKKAIKTLESAFEEKFAHQQSQIVKLEKELASLRRELNYQADTIHNVKYKLRF